MNAQDFQVSGVYLIHLNVPYKHAQHYIGYAESSIANRILEHVTTICEPPIRPLGETSWVRYGKGSKFLGVLNYLKIDWILARVWEAQDRTFERRLKNWKNSSLLCPVCRGEEAYNNMKGNNANEHANH
jgi:hypothetical protein